MVFLFGPMKKWQECNFSIIDKFVFSGVLEIQGIKCFLWEKDGILAVRRSNGIGVDHEDNCRRRKSIAIIYDIFATSVPQF